MKLDFLEIGTSDFDTLAQYYENNNTVKGMSIEPINYYLNKLPVKDNLIKLNAAITFEKLSDFIYVYFIPEDVILKNNLPIWFKGCNKINDYHPLHIKYNIKNLVKIESVKVYSFKEVLEIYNINFIDYIKIDTEGHDIEIMKSLYECLESKILIEIPKKIQFEANSNINKSDIDFIKNLYKNFNYNMHFKDEDMIFEKL